MAARFYERAAVTYTALFDTTHAVTRLYGMVNVPSGVWIDEEGRIVRPPETAYSRRHQLGPLAVGDDRYVKALRDWVRRGAESPFAMSAEELAERLAPRHANRARADAHFALGAHLFAAGELDAALPHWKEAQRLDPDNWNYHRDPWSLDELPAGPRWFKKLTALKGPYYEPLGLP